MLDRIGSFHTHVNAFQGVPTALEVLAAAEGPIEPFPVLSLSNKDLRGHYYLVDTDALPPIRFDKSENQPVRLSVYVRISDDADKDTLPSVVITPCRETLSHARLQRLVPKWFHPE